jgi:hypothetical protein
MNESRANSVRHLEGLYTVVVGLGLSLSILNVVDPKLEGLPIRIDLLPYFISFLVTIIPFYHGALRHLYITYVEKEGKQVRNGALLADFVMLFIESCFFLGLAVLITKPLFFAWGLATLLLFDSVWGFTAHIGFSQDVKPKAEVRWALINLLTTAGLVIYFCLIDMVPIGASVQAGAKLAIGLIVISVLRTVIDYAVSWNFYYPSS